MTIISGTNNYALATLLSQTANKQASAAGGGTTTSASSTSAGSSTTTSAKTVAQAIAAAANSVSYDFATVGQNARTVLNAGISAYGQTPGSQTSQQDWVTIFGGMTGVHSLPSPATRAGSSRRWSSRKPSN